MLVPTAQLPQHRGKVSMVDGGFDPIHDGHIAYFREARSLGLPVLCNVASDRYIARKHAPLLKEAQRVAVLDAIRYVDFVHLNTTSTADVLQRLRPKFYVKGSDWKGRLPREETEVCATHGIDVRFLDTVVDSSSRLLAEYLSKERLKP